MVIHITYCCHRNELTYKVDDLNAQLRTAKEYVVCPCVCLYVYLSVCLFVVYSSVHLFFCLCLCICLLVNSLSHVFIIYMYTLI